MSTPNSTLRQRGPKEKAKVNGTAETNADELLDSIVESSKKAVTSEWEYKLALAVITALSFLTRFWGISHPDEVVFDEVHFGKVSTTLWKLEITCADEYSLHHTTCSEPTSSMFTRHSASFYLR